MTDTISLSEPYTLGAPPGRDGHTPLLQKTSTHIQWKVGDGEWQNLVALVDIKGASGEDGDDGDNGQEIELQATESHIQWRLGAGAWADLVPLADLKGDQGNDGQAVSLQKTATHIQWRLGAGSWQDLVALADIKGNTGDTGAAALMSIGTVETLPTGSEATADITGDAPNFQLNLGIPMGPAGAAGAGSATIEYVAISSADTLDSNERGDFVTATGTFTLGLDSAATLGNGWWCYVRNGGTGDITLGPSGAETIDGLSSFIMYPGEVRLLQCDGSTFRSLVTHGFYKVFTASGNFIKPPGYRFFEGLLWGGGGGGGKHATFIYGGCGGACAPLKFASDSLSDSVAFTIGAGGTPSTSAPAGNGGDSSFSGVTAYGGPGANTTTVSGGDAFYSGTNGDTVEGASATAAGSAFFGGGAGGLTAGRGLTVYGGGGGGGIDSSAVVTIRGTTIYGGPGGAAGDAVNGSDGTAPGGGGGSTRAGTQGGTGARGELRIWGGV